jgi:stress-induced-phosphoprotein 1
MLLLPLLSGEASEEELKERQAKGMADPEVQNILMDPIMRQVSQRLARTASGVDYQCPLLP